VSPGLCGGGGRKEDEFGSVGSVGASCFLAISAALSHQRLDRRSSNLPLFSLPLTCSSSPRLRMRLFHRAFEPLNTLAVTNTNGWAMQELSGGAAIVTRHGCSTWPTRRPSFDSLSFEDLQHHDARSDVMELLCRTHHSVHLSQDWPPLNTPSAWTVPIALSHSCRDCYACWSALHDCHAQKAASRRFISRLELTRSTSTTTHQFEVSKGLSPRDDARSRHVCER
jgi:hypothetical protein